MFYRMEVESLDLCEAALRLLLAMSEGAAVEAERTWAERGSQDLGFKV